MNFRVDCYDIATDTWQTKAIGKPKDFSQEYISPSPFSP